MLKKLKAIAFTVLSKAQDKLEGHESAFIGFLLSLGIFVSCGLFFPYMMNNLGKEAKALVIEPVEVVSSVVPKEEGFLERSRPVRMEEVEKVVQESSTVVPVSDGSVLTKSMGVNYFGSQKETYYNLNMDGVVGIMRGIGFVQEDYPYWIRQDGVKMLGNYVIVAANLNVYPRGSLVETSLGTAIVCDTGEFAYNNPLQVDIAVNW